MAEPGNGSKARGGAKAKGAPRPKHEEKAEEQKPVCTVAFCPICMAVTAAQGAAPDALEHLLAAAREFFLAARAVIDVRGDGLSGTPAEPPAERRFERIDIS